ncbi:mandelate racemase/muconate lactonizing enzyme family protein [Siccirubricoccus sp. KC 17139]|uniref:Mandelate racemase/muconate lactonizing enzyme family protein n=1 Tax=Siccirubricoccus soli TaxID=2899147 RepID=A0ABT1D6S1_9PROT|nr:mandelate racemase/muconate lactonizing enzyme family protein [Siccirubricoccus soli]MCO6417287.1 mandelate racemase/muconate lactonizing enzyme family protein [Siccirubricoccus soli]MCP2683422.1 mandelate racemase/muconate lactonizing enzyme family protein [Siccirubricoccus soli]
MRITSVETSVVALPFTMGGPHPLFAGRPWDKLEILLVRVETEDGLVGWGEAFGHAAIPATKAALDTTVAPLVLGRDAQAIETLTRGLMHATHLLGRNGPHLYAISGIEIALWDLLGKRAGMPVWALLGGRERASLPAYASLLSYGNDLALVARNTAEARQAGYRHIKLHELTREAVLAAKRAAPDAAIMLDVNCAWTPPVARDMAAALAGDGLYWLEEPVWPPEDSRGLASLRRHGIPLSAGENTAGLFGFKALVEAGAIDIAQPSVTKVGGIGEMLRVFRFCQAQGVEVVPHCPYFGPGFVATLHIAAALCERPLVEVLWLEMEANPFDPWVRARNGQVTVPQGPGLGCDPDPAILARYLSAPPTRTAARTPS